jgi:hypothetical protein
MAAFARSPGPRILPVQLSPMRSRTGPFTTIGKARPVVLCDITGPMPEKASTTAMTAGRYSGRHPAMTAFAAASCTVHSLPRWGARQSTSPGSRAVWARNSSTNSPSGGTTGSPSVQPLSKQYSMARRAARASSSVSSALMDRAGR